MVTASQAPDLVMLALIRQMTITDQLIASQVCRRWAKLVQEVTQRRRSLALLLVNNKDAIGRKWGQGERRFEVTDSTLSLLLDERTGRQLFPQRRCTKWNSIQYRSQRQQQNKIAKLVALFPSIIDLQLVIESRSKSQYASAILVLSSWRRQLISLKLIQQSTLPFTSKVCARDLFKVINSLAVLKHLHLDLSWMPDYDLPIISQLETFDYFSGTVSPFSFAAMLEQHTAQSRRNLRHIGYRSQYDYNSDDVMLRFAQLPDHIRASFSYVDFPDQPITNLDLLTNRFLSSSSSSSFSASIQRLDIGLTGVNTFSIRTLYRRLTHFSQLVYLRLTVDFAFYVPLYTDEESDDQSAVAQLHSVKGLWLNLLMHSHHEMAQLKIGAAFPELQVLQLHFDCSSECASCGVGRGAFFAKSPTSQQLSLYSDCLCQMLTLLRCNGRTTLRLIRHNMEHLPLI